MATRCGGADRPPQQRLPCPREWPRSRPTATWGWPPSPRTKCRKHMGEEAKWRDIPAEHQP
eukprot:15435005-Alexandrium_andersonii.AAC.1